MGVFTFVNVAIHDLIFVDLSLFDLIIEMLDSSPIIVIDGVIREENLFGSLSFIFSGVLN